MAITKIAGELLESNLIRVTNLAFNEDAGNNTALLFFDVANNRLGVNTNAPGNFALDVNGSTRIQGDLTVTGTTTTVDSQNLSVEDNMIVLNSSGSVGHDSGVMINRGAAGDNAVMLWDESTDKFQFGTTTTSDGSTREDYGVALKQVQVGEPNADQDASTRKYVDDSVTSLSGTLSSNLSSAVAAVTGMDTNLSTPDDSTFGDGALTSLTSTTKVTDAIDGLNETMENIRNSTYVKSVTYTANPTAGSLGTIVALNISPIGGGANRYDVNWGDGTAVQTVTTTTPTHDYDENSGQPYTISVKAYNNTAVSGSSGSFANSGDSQTNQVITVYTSQPVPAFAIYAAASGGLPITKADSGATVYLQNNTSFTAGASVTYDIDWGDTTENTIASDSAAGGKNGTRLAHTYNNSANDDISTVAGTGTGDTKYQIRLRLLTHTTADPSVVPAQATSNFEVYTAQTAAYAANSIRGINEEATNGFPVTFTNNTATLPGANSAFSETQQYSYNFDEGSTVTVAVGSSGAGDTGNAINNTFNLSMSEQNAGTTVAYNTTLTLATGRSGADSSAAITITVEPDVRATIVAAANIESTKSGDDEYDLYDVVDLDGANRALTTFTNSSKNADNYDYDFFSDSTSITTVAENGSNAGSINATLSKNFSGTSAGNFVTRFRAYGTPDTFFQDDEKTIAWQMNSTPSAPANLSSKSLTLSDSAQGTQPKLCHGFTDNTAAFTTQSAGDALNTTTARRYTSGTIDTNICTNFLTNDSNGTGSTVNQTLTAKINNASKGTRTFTTAEGGANNTTDDTLVITNHRDADASSIGNFPQRMFLVATAKITEALTDYSIGSNAQRLESSAGGNTNIVHVVRDDVTSVPTTSISGTTVAEGTAGTKRYISGVAYYNSGSPTVTMAGTTIANLTGQAYRDETIGTIHRPHEIGGGTNQESTTGEVLVTDPTTFTFANIDGSTTMLDSGIPKSDTGVGSAYAIGTITVPIGPSGTKTVKTIGAKSRNANGDEGSYQEHATKIQVYTATPTGLDKEDGGITVSDSLGNGSTHIDDALRITGFGSSSDTPSFNSSTNYYTGNAWSGAETVAGTTEAISRFGTIKHFTTDLRSSNGYLPNGPDCNTGRNGGEAQYYTFAFRRTPVQNFTITMTGTVSGMFIACPGNANILAASGNNGWMNMSTAYDGSGIPGTNAGGGGNGSNGCASGSLVNDGQAYSGAGFGVTFGTESTANTSSNVVLVRIKLNSGDSVTALSIS